MTDHKIRSHRREPSKTVEGVVVLVTGSLVAFTLGLVAPMLVQL